MAASYPGGIYSPRTKENRAGVVYDASKKTITYMEDVVFLDDEMVAVETELGTNPKRTSADVAERIKGLRSLADADADVIIIKLGKVGLGTNNPDNLLDVLGDTFIGDALNGVIIRKNGVIGEVMGLNSDVSDWNDLLIRVANAQIYLKENGNIGIGINNTNPGRQLELLHATSPTLSLKSTSLTGNSQIFFGDAGDDNIGRLVYNHTTDDFEFKLGSAKKVIFNMVDGRVGIMNATPTQILDIKAKTGFSEIGGHIIKLTNKTGGVSVKGNLVETSIANDDAIQLSSANSLEPIGVFLEAGVADGDEAWIVVGGIAEVRADAGGWVKGDWINSSAVVGRCEGGAHVPNPAKHMQEVGHALGDAAGNGLAKVVLHFN